MKSLRKKSLFNLVALIIIFLFPGVVYLSHLLNENAPGDRNNDGVSDDPPPSGRYTISSDYGPRDVTSGSFFHNAIDYRLKLNEYVTSVEAGQIVNIDLVGFVEVKIQSMQQNPPHNPMPIFRYLHMFQQVDIAPSVQLPMRPMGWTNGEFTLTSDQVIIWWAPNPDNFRRARRVYAMQSTNQVRNPYYAANSPNAFVLNRDGTAAINRTTTVAIGDTIGPCGGQGGFDPHMHIDLGLGATTNPLFHINHPRTQLFVEELHGEPFIDANVNGIPDPSEVSLPTSFTDIDDNKRYTSDRFLANEPNAVVFHTPNHHYERLRYRVKSIIQNPPARVDWYNSPLDFDRLRIFLYPANTNTEVRTIDFTNINSFTNRRYLIHGDAPAIVVNTLPTDNQIFRADFRFGGRPNGEIIDGVDVGSLFPEFLDDPQKTALSVNGLKTGVRINDLEREKSVAIDGTIGASDVGPGVRDAGADEFVYNQWNTRVCSTYVDLNGGGVRDGVIDDAIVNSFPTNPNFGARYPDGRYLLVAYAEDVNRTPDHARLTPTDRSIVIDNFRPFVQRVAAVSQNKIIYQAGWEFNPNNKMYEIDPKTTKARHIGYVGRNVDVAVTVIFNETIAYEDTDNNIRFFFEAANQIKLDPLGPEVGALPIVPTGNPEISDQIPLDMNVIQANFKFSIPEASKLNYFGDAVLIVDVRDLGEGEDPMHRGNKLLFLPDILSEFSPKDSLQRDNNGKLRGNKKLPIELQRDTYHKIMIDPVEPKATITNNIKRQPDVPTQGIATTASNHK